MNDIETFSQNNNVIVYVLFISIMASLEKNIDSELWSTIIQTLKDTMNEYQLFLSNEVLEYVDKTGQLETEDYVVLESVLGRGEEDV